MEIDPATQVRSISFDVIRVAFLTYNDDIINILKIILNSDTETCVFIFTGRCWHL